MAEVIAFISDSYSWKMRVSFSLLKIFFEKKSFLLLLFFHSAVASQCSSMTPYLKYNILSLSWMLFKLKITG